jgi:hypothetical protein
MNLFARKLERPMDSSETLRGRKESDTVPHRVTPASHSPVHQIERFLSWFRQRGVPDKLERSEWRHGSILGFRRIDRRRRRVLNCSLWGRLLRRERSICYDERERKRKENVRNKTKITRKHAGTRKHSSARKHRGEG